MDISSILESASMTAPVSQAKSPEQAGRVFETMLFELLLKETGLANSLASGVGKEWTILGDHFIQMLASQLAQEVDLGTGRQLAADNSVFAQR